MKKFIAIAQIGSVISECAADTSVQETPPAAVEAQETESKVDQVIIALGLFIGWCSDCEYGRK
jgi:hypothetical protein